MTISADPNTWPSGDPIWNIARAIAMAEGANVPGSNPDRLNNPGDISDGVQTFGAEFHSGSHVTHFPDKQTGWQWLYNKIQNAASGASSVFGPTMTWFQFGQHYAPPNWQVWASNVAAALGVDPNSTLAEYLSPGTAPANVADPSIDPTTAGGSGGGDILGILVVAGLAAWLVARLWS